LPQKGTGHREESRKKLKDNRKRDEIRNEKILVNDTSDTLTTRGDREPKIPVEAQTSLLKGRRRKCQVQKEQLGGGEYQGGGRTTELNRGERKEKKSIYND